MIQIPQNLIEVYWSTCCPACLQGDKFHNREDAEKWTKDHENEFQGQSKRYLGMIVDTKHIPFITNAQVFRGFP